MNITKAIPALFVATIFCCAFQAQAEGQHWSYGGHGGPAEWGELDQR
jgi:carbonic anhydrase